jgi:hypothetical protein
LPSKYIGKIPCLFVYIQAYQKYNSESDILKRKNGQLSFRNIVYYHLFQCFPLYRCVCVRECVCVCVCVCEVSYLLQKNRLHKGKGIYFLFRSKKEKLNHKQQAVAGRS